MQNGMNAFLNKGNKTEIYKSHVSLYQEMKEK